ncbi:PIN domain-containing protein [Paracoccus sp. S-4012]|uniref:type II toxin-antitoxin system VapC family toxin n=1 Tax=Paracoccus sp. S-4012 TaxID=2665648 RepID=UPI0013269912|nr:PIN domain-containing protein [Paracoccus sp. S-4012]
MSDTTGPESARAAAGGQQAYVLDASALLCLINGEPGADRVAAVLPSAVISAVNLAEVASKLNELGADADTARVLLAPLHLSVVPFDESAAHTTGALRTATRGQGLSLGDRACLALCVSRSATALTTDKAWSHVNEIVGVPVETL